MHFTPPDEQLAEAFNITWDPDAWGQEESTKVYATFPNYQNPLLSMFAFKASKKGHRADR